jgi:hypothetical protein
MLLLYNFLNGSGTTQQRCRQKSMVSGSYSSWERLQNYYQIDPEAIYRMLTESLESRLLDSKTADFAASAGVPDKKLWPKDINSELTFGGNEVSKLSIRLQLNERDTIREFQKYLTQIQSCKKFKHLKSALSTIPVL